MAGQWPPHLRLTRNVLCSSHGSAEGTGNAVVDNFVCSHLPALQRLGIERSSPDAVAVSWEGHAALLESSSPEGPWAPCIAEANNSESRFMGQFSPRDSQRFFTLATGRYLTSRFDDVGEWHAAKADIGTPGGLFGIQVSSGQASTNARSLSDQDFLISRGVTGLWWRDCVASVDVLNWEGTAFGIVLRAKPQTGFWLIKEEGLPENRYIGLLTFNKPGSPEESMLSITGPSGELLQETTLPGVDRLKDYRLRFWAVGEQLKLELCDTEDLATPIATCEASDDRCPTGIEALFVKPSPTGQTQIDFDNFLLWGVWTPAEW